MAVVLITGGAGCLGSAMLSSAPDGWRVHPTVRTRTTDLPEAEVLDLADRASVREAWSRVRPDLVVHTAYSMKRPGLDIAQATRNVADATREVGAALVHLSTDMLFDGERAPYAEDALPTPILEYGSWKAEAEEYVRETSPDAAIIRTSLMTSFSPLDPRSGWIASGLRGELSATLYTDEIRCPIAVVDLAAQLWEICTLEREERAGVWHLAGPEALSRYAIGLLVAAHLGIAPDRLTAGTTSDSPTPRPRDLRLLTTRADAMLETRARPISTLVGR